MIMIAMTVAMMMAKRTFQLKHPQVQGKRVRKKEEEYRLLRMSSQGNVPVCLS